MEITDQMAAAENNPSPSRRDVWKMFDRIAGRYDFLNRLLSCGTDVRWRKRMTRYLPDREHLKLLDLATGTADQILSMVQHSGKIAGAVGIDMSEKMLEVGRKKIAAKLLDHMVDLQVGDAVSIPLDDQTVDAVTMSFGIRNVTDVERCLSEMLRTLKAEGRALILEFSLPKNGFMRASYLFYLRHILPRIGGLLSGDAAAYRYLNETIESFPYGADFCELMKGVGFTRVDAYPLSFGIATIYVGTK